MFLNPSMLFHILKVYSFLSLSSIPFLRVTVVCLSILLMEFGAVYSFMLLFQRAAENILLQAFCEHMFLLPLGKYPFKVSELATYRLIQLIFCLTGFQCFHTALSPSPSSRDHFHKKPKGRHN